MLKLTLIDNTAGGLVDYYTISRLHRKYPVSSPRRR